MAPELPPVSCRWIDVTLFFFLFFVFISIQNVLVVKCEKVFLYEKIQSKKNCNFEWNRPARSYKAGLFVTNPRVNTPHLSYTENLDHRGRNGKNHATFEKRFRDWITHGECVNGGRKEVIFYFNFFDSPKRTFVVKKKLF